MGSPSIAAGFRSSSDLDAHLAPTAKRAPATPTDVDTPGQRRHRRLPGYAPTLRCGVSDQHPTTVRRRLNELVRSFETNRAATVVDRGVEVPAAYALGVKAAVHESLVKLDRGTYGTCDQCGDPIDQHRLRRVPFARRCEHCQQHEEDSWNEVERMVASIVRNLVGEPQGRAIDPDESHQEVPTSLPRAHRL